MVTITIKTPIENTILGKNGEDAIKKGLRLLVLVGNEHERNQATVVLEMLGETVHQRPIF